MNRTLVIGYGNTLRGDDGAGVRAVELLAAQVPEVDCLCLHELQPELAETISRYDEVYFLDATISSTDLRHSTLEPDSAALNGSHALSPAALLSLSKALYFRRPDTAILIEIPAWQCDFGETLSTPTQGFVDACVESLQRSFAVAH